MSSAHKTLANESRQFGNNYTIAATDDVDIDPMLNASTTTGPMPQSAPRPLNPQFIMNPPSWNPAMSNSVGFYPPEWSAVLPAASATSPRAAMEMQSSPGTTPSDPVFETSRTSSKSSVPSINSMSETNTKPRRSNRGSNSQHRKPPNQSAASPPRRKKTAKAPTLEEDEDEEEDDAADGDDTKRNKFLKRNRIAASKCRQKKKEWVNNLEETRYGLEHQHSNLQMEYNGLVDEVSRMKTQLMQHAACNDANINQWIENEARKFVQRTAAQTQGHLPCDGVNCCHSHHRHRSLSSAMSIPKTTESEFNYDHMPDSETTESTAKRGLEKEASNTMSTLAGKVDDGFQSYSTAAEATAGRGVWRLWRLRQELVQKASMGRGQGVMRYGL
ncbi:transcription factor [Fusarium albosuccineum]|uniref:Transcription factor n=1 Tax=Fusarium albosuccineum TaxID=1237068 RepID=A0A8H4LJE0_9HYPO|nr:transcription factor [Fusarium albosuccineum]